MKTLIRDKSGELVEDWDIFYIPYLMGHGGFRKKLESELEKNKKDLGINGNVEILDIFIENRECSIKTGFVSSEVQTLYGVIYRKL